MGDKSAAQIARLLLLLPSSCLSLKVVYFHGMTVPHYVEKNRRTSFIGRAGVRVCENEDEDAR